MLEIKSLVAIQTGNADDMVGRNYTTTITPQAYRQYQEMTNGGAITSPEAIAGLAGQMIVADPNGIRPLQIDNGWGARRLRFVLTMGYPANHMGGESVRFIYTGYTDHVGYVPQAKDFDPNMRIFFNNAISLVTTHIQTPHGLEPFVQVNDICHLLNPRSLGGGLMSTFDPNTFAPMQQPSTLRPRDLFDHMATEAESRSRGGVPIVDMNTAVGMKKASRDNNVPSKYLSKAVRSIGHAIDIAAPDASEQHLYSTASGYTSEPAVYGDEFISSLMDMGFAINGFVTWRDLCSRYPDFAKKMQYYDHQVQSNMVQSVETGEKYMISRGENEQWINGNGQVNISTEATIANSVMQSVPATLLRNLVTRCVIVATNMRVGGGLHVEIRTPIPMTDVPQGFLISRIPIIEAELASIIFNDLPFNKEIPFFIEMHMDIFGESFIRVSYNGKHTVPFAMTSYCDAMTSPVVASTNNPLIQMANDIRYLSGFSTTGE